MTLTYLVDVLCRCDALPVVLAVAEVGHQHLEQLRLLKREFFDALQFGMIQLDFSYIYSIYSFVMSFRNAPS